MQSCSGPSRHASQSPWWPHALRSVYPNLILHVPWADKLPTQPDLPPGWSQDEADGYREAHSGAYNQWGSGQTARLWSTTMDSPYNRRLMGLLERSSATPPVAQAHGEWFSKLDITDVFRAIQVPTHVIRQETDRIPDAVVGRVAGLIPDATYRSLPAASAGSSLGEGYSEVIDDAAQMLLGGDARRGGGRSLGSVLFTDIVGSTELLVKLGHERYRRLRDDHERSTLPSKRGGRLVKVLGDGTLSVFEGPGERSDVRTRSVGRPLRSDSKSGREYTPVRSSAPALTWSVFPYTSAPAVSGGPTWRDLRLTDGPGHRGRLRA